MHFLKSQDSNKTNKRTILITVIKLNDKKRHNEALTSYKRVWKDSPTGLEIIIYTAIQFIFSPSNNEKFSVKIKIYNKLPSASKRIVSIFSECKPRRMDI